MHDEDVMRYSSVTPELLGEWDEQRAARYLEASNKSWRENDFGCWAVRLRDGSFVGFVVVERSSSDGEVWIGAFIRKEFWSQGLATNGGPLLLRAIFSNPRIDIVSAATRIENKRAQRLLTGLGAAFQGQAQYRGSEHLFYRLSRPDPRRATP